MMNNIEMGRLVRRCREITQGGIPCFFDYSGHVDCVSISFFRYGYHEWLKFEDLVSLHYINRVNFKEILTKMDNIIVLEEVQEWVDSHADMIFLNPLTVNSDGHIYDKRRRVI